MYDSPFPSPSRGVIALPTTPEQDWQPILHSSNQVVLYNPKSHALSINSFSNYLTVQDNACPYCKRALPEGFEYDTPEHKQFGAADPTHHTRTPDYFQLLSMANESGPPPLTAPAHEDNERAEAQGEGTSRAFPTNTMAEGYFKRFFQEEYKLGMGANGSVYLCQVSRLNAGSRFLTTSTDGSIASMYLMEIHSVRRYYHLVRSP
jgi:hypothetical protein